MIIILGKMGENMVTRLLLDGHAVKPKGEE
jgi:6-phosphogluconate dehydrogenase (decarboxylating)